MATAMPLGFCVAVADKRRPTLTTDTADFSGDEIEHEAGDIDVDGFAEPFPAGDGVDFDGVEATIAAGKEIDAGEGGVDGGGGAASHCDQRIVRREGFGGGAPTDVGPPVELVAAAHSEDAVADDEQAYVVAFVGYEFLQVEHRAELGEHFEGAEGEGFVI